MTRCDDFEQALRLQLLGLRSYAARDYNAHRSISQRMQIISLKTLQTPTVNAGSTENTRVEDKGRSKMWRWKMQKWKYREDNKPTLERQTNNFS